MGALGALHYQGSSNWEVRMFRRGGFAALGGVALLSFALSGSTLAAPSGGDVRAGLVAIRQATQRYHDVNRALADGYVPVSECVAAPGLGAMGIHYLNPAFAADLAVNLLTPEVLLYAPSSDGPRLVAVEYFVAALANTGAAPAPWFGAEAPTLGFFNSAPSLLGHTFNGPMAGHDPNMPWHYDLHVWVWQANPAGTFNQFNPKVSC